VHTVLLLASLLVVMLVSHLALRSQQRLPDWAHRRIIQGVVLVMPLLSLGISACDLHHVLDHPCFSHAPFWDGLLGSILALGIIAMALFALTWGCVRWALLLWFMRRAGESASLPIQDLVVACAQRIGTRRPAVRLQVAARPLACTSGWTRPLLLLSTWMVEHLDRRELEAVITHELAHVARRDTLVLWVGRMLRDAFWYLPTSRTAYHLLEQEKELACDDLAVAVTQRPLALASALTKVWLQAADGASSSTFGMAQHLEGAHQQMVERIERLMASPRSTALTVSAPSGVSVLGALGAIESVILLMLFAVMACGPLLLLTRWF
jgi:beta-lactamase regulating signal transducer with metallopeptidase domain